MESIKNKITNEIYTYYKDQVSWVLCKATIKMSFWVAISSQSLTREGPASKLTWLVVGRIQFFVDQQAKGCS